MAFFLPELQLYWKNSLFFSYTEDLERMPVAGDSIHRDEEALIGSSL
jgi:hypothetical protein